MTHEIPDLALVGTLYQWLDGQINSVNGDVYQLGVVETRVLIMLRTTLRDMSAQADDWMERRLTIQGVDWPAPSELHTAHIFRADDSVFKEAVTPDWGDAFGEDYHGHH